MKNLLVLFLISILCASCYTEPEEDTNPVQGMKPVYLTKDQLGTIESQEARPYGNLGKIVSSGNNIYINERLEGIHVIDNSDPTMPDIIQFWSIPGNVDFTITGTTLYADNSFDLLTIDISDPKDIKLLSTVENIYPNDENTADFPGTYFGPFECADSSLGIVVDWEEATLINPKCRR